MRYALLFCALSLPATTHAGSPLKRAEHMARALVQSGKSADVSQPGVVVRRESSNDIRVDLDMGRGGRVYRKFSLAPDGGLRLEYTRTGKFEIDGVTGARRRFVSAQHRTDENGGLWIDSHLRLQARDARGRFLPAQSATESGQLPSWASEALRATLDGVAK